MMKDYLKKVFSGYVLTESESRSSMDLMMQGKACPEQIGAFLAVLKVRGESVEELIGFAKSLRDHARPLSINRNDIVDTCGTGGDGADTFNISTVSSIVLAAAGLGVCKHGNRSVSSRCGSADVLEELGVPIDYEPQQVSAMVDAVGFGFLFAPKFHPAMAHVAPVRKNLGVRTLFNILGPIVNPAQTRRQIIGVYDKKLLETLPRVLQELGSEEVMVVCGSDGLDEITTTGPSFIAHLKDGSIREYQVSPEDFGMKRSKLEDLKGGDRERNAEIVVNILNGEERGPKRDIVLLNSAAALLVTGNVCSIEEGIIQIAKILDSGKAYEKLQQIKLGEEYA